MSKKKLSELTAADVIGAALEQIRTEEGYTDGFYFLDEKRERTLDEPGANVGATCAIGGVEQALWRLTGQVVTGERERAAYPENRQYGRLFSPRSTVSRLYFEAMAILNRVALRTRRAWEFDSGEGVCPIEQLTFLADRPTVVRAFRRALKEAEKAAA